MVCQTGGHVGEGGRHGVPDWWACRGGREAWCARLVGL